MPLLFAEVIGTGVIAQKGAHVRVLIRVAQVVTWHDAIQVAGPISGARTSTNTAALVQAAPSATRTAIMWRSRIVILRRGKDPIRPSANLALGCILLPGLEARSPGFRGEVVTSVDNVTV